MSALIKVGKLGRAFGTDGGMTITLYDNFPEEIIYEEPLWVVIDSLAVPLFIEDFRRKGRSKAVVRFSDIESIRATEEFYGMEVSVRTDSAYLELEAEDDDGEELKELIGYRAIMSEADTSIKLMGLIERVSGFDINPLFHISTDKGEVLIPVVEEFIVSIDRQAKTLEMELPAGLLTLED